MYLAEESRIINNGLSVKIVVYCLLIIDLNRKSKIVLFGSKNGYLKDKPTKHFPEILVIPKTRFRRSEEHTSELQSRENLVCRLLLEKKKKNNKERKTIQRCI